MHDSWHGDCYHDSCYNFYDAYYDGYCYSYFTFDCANGRRFAHKCEGPSLLDLSPYVVSARTGPLWYRRVAVVEHHGATQHTGHYTCFVRRGDHCFLADNHPPAKQLPVTLSLHSKADRGKAAYCFVYELVPGWVDESTQGNRALPGLSHAATALVETAARDKIPLVTEFIARAPNPLSSNAVGEFLQLLNLSSMPVLCFHGPFDVARIALWLRHSGVNVFGVDVFMFPVRIGGAYGGAAG